MSDMGGPKRLFAKVVGGFVLSMTLLGINIARWWQFHHSQEIFDGGLKIGFPFGFWQTEMFAGGNVILWPGLLADLAIAVLLGWVGVKIADRAYSHITK